MAINVDQGQVLMTGENSFIRLSDDGGQTLTDRLSHWRVLWCPAGAGHALFMKSELTGGAVRIYSDNIAVARWLQRAIESVLFAEFADESLPVLPAVFARMGDPRSCAVELIESDEDVIRMTDSYGHWKFSPDGAGGTDVRYETTVDLGGSLPGTWTPRSRRVGPTRSETWLAASTRCGVRSTSSFATRPRRSTLSPHPSSRFRTTSS